MKKEIYRSKYEAYPFLCDDMHDLKCDFEIFTDEIACQIGLLLSMVKQDYLKEELLKICELVYHMNPSLRTFVSLTVEELKWLESSVLRLKKETEGRCDKFVLNQGCENACRSHIIRTKFKALVRMMYRYIQLDNEVPDILLDFANLFSGYFFYLALLLNKFNGIDEIEFISRNYK